jgi:hypothetical protein
VLPSGLLHPSLAACVPLHWPAATQVNSMSCWRCMRAAALATTHCCRLCAAVQHTWSAHAAWASCRLGYRRLHGMQCPTSGASVHSNMHACAWLATRSCQPNHNRPCLFRKPCAQSACISELQNMPRLLCQHHRCLLCNCIRTLRFAHGANAIHMLHFAHGARAVLNAACTPLGGKDTRVYTQVTWTGHVHATCGGHT